MVLFYGHFCAYWQSKNPYTFGWDLDKQICWNATQWLQKKYDHYQTLIQQSHSKSDFKIDEFSYLMMLMMMIIGIINKNIRSKCPSNAALSSQSNYVKQNFCSHKTKQLFLWLHLRLETMQAYYLTSSILSDVCHQILLCISLGIHNLTLVAISAEEQLPLENSFICSGSKSCISKWQWS